MKKGYTDITVVLDKSGSMKKIQEATIQGFNHFLRKQKEFPGFATISLIQFNEGYQPIYMNKNIQDAKFLSRKSFYPEGITALIDAIGRTIDNTGLKYLQMFEHERPEKVLIVIITDGLENASQKYIARYLDTTELVQQNAFLHVNNMINHQREKYSWEFIFLGANQDAIASACQLGIKQTHALTYMANATGTQAMYDTVAKKVCNYRFKGATGQSLVFDDEDRNKQDKAKE